MDKACKFNKDHLLEFYFGEGQATEEPKIRSHLRECAECRAYLSDLEQTDQIFRQWKEEAPLPRTFDWIVDQISQTSPKKAALESSPVSPPMSPFFQILGLMAALFGLISLLHNQLKLSSFWENIQEWRIIQFLGPFGLTAVFVFIIGTFITLSLSPILIWESQPRN